MICLLSSFGFMFQVNGQTQLSCVSNDFLPEKIVLAPQAKISSPEL